MIQKLSSLLLTTIALCGCTTGLPIVDSESPSDAVRLIGERGAGVDAVSAHGVMTMESMEGQIIRMEIALAAVGPSRMRLRAWKLGHAAMDLTILDHQAWLWVGGDSRGDEQSFFSRFFLRHRLAWDALRGTLPGTAPDSVESLPDKRIRATFPVDAGERLVVYVDGPTLTVREYELQDLSEGTANRVHVLEYKVIAGAPRPSRIRAVGEQGVITLDLEDLTINPELSPRALQPPDRAEMIGSTSSRG